MRRIEYTHEFAVQSENGRIRVIVCSEDCARSAHPLEGQTTPIEYKFKGGDAVAKIGDLFLDCSGELYWRLT